jgi:hypothetical protein
MRERGFSTVGGILLAGLAGILTAAVITDWMVVDIQVTDPDPMHFTVPFPLFLADAATSFVPDEAFEETHFPPELKANRELILAALGGLLESPDSALIKVEAPDARVEISKTGDNILIWVDADDAMVRCTVPLDGVLHALEKWDWETFDPDLVFDALGKADNGPLIEIEVDDGTRVAVNLW